MLKQIANSWLDDYVPSMGAALAFYILFSLTPLLLMVISVAGLAFGEDAARGGITAQLGSLMGKRCASAVQDLLSRVAKPAQGSFATALGLVLLFIGATTVFGELQDSLDRIWRVPARARTGGWFSLVRSRLLSFGMILAIGFLLTVSLVVVLLWVYYSAQIFLIGAEFAWVYANTDGSRRSGPGLATSLDVQ